MAMPPKPSGDALHGGYDAQQLHALSKLGAKFFVWSDFTGKWSTRDPMYEKNHRFSDALWYKLKERDDE
jgi:hypothetical protein